MRVGVLFRDRVLLLLLLERSKREAFVREFLFGRV